MYDCIIVGAGPAGTTAAYHLAKNQRSVLVVDKAALPRSKPCGGGVSPAIQEWFDCDFAPAIETTVQRVYYTWKLGDPVQADLEKVQPMWMVQRDKFDHFLAQQAQQQGATLQEQTEVLGLTRTSQSWQVKTAQAMLEARYLIAADGVNSICAKWLGFAPHTSFMGASLEISSLQGSLSPDRAYFDFGSLKNGYIWVFPKKKGYSISGGCFKGNLKSEELKKQLYHYAQQQGLDTAQAQYQEYPLNLWTENQPLHTDKALLAGEAAGLLDPLLGEGIRPAILSGVRAAEAINRALAGQETALAQYTQILTDEWGKEMSLAQKLAGIFYQFPQVAYKVALKRPAAAQLMGQILCGQLRYSDVTEQVMQTLKKKLIPGFGR